MMIWNIINANVISGLKSLPDKSAHCVCTSPPYFGLRAYGTQQQIWGGNPSCEHAWKDYTSQPMTGGGSNKSNKGSFHGGGACGACGAWRGELGSEPTLEMYIENIVAVGRELWRVLRDDGTFWLNLGDSYAGAKRATGNFKAKDRMMVPARVAIALQEDGWWLRDEVVWHKPNPMPSSVKDRTTSAHEMIYLFAKNSRYFYDSYAVKIASVYPNDKRRPLGLEGAWRIDGRSKGENGGGKPYDHDTSKSNLRSVWKITPEPYKGAHFAVFPGEIPRRCIKAGTSEYGVCVECGAPWRRLTSRSRVATRPGVDTKVTGDAMTDGNRDPKRHVTTTRAVGWGQTCKCSTIGTVPATVLDPFSGSATTLAVAIELGRRAIGIELNPEYVKLGETRCMIAEEKFSTPIFDYVAKADSQ